jgi:PilZ domain
MRFRSRSRASVLAVEQSGENQRLHHRHKLRSLAYVSLEFQKAGVLRDISEGGLAVQVLRPLHTGQQVRFALDLPNPKLRFEADARVVWTDSLGQAGMEFLELAPRLRRLLKDWLFTQVLAEAQRSVGEQSAELLFSHDSRPAIRLITPNRRASTRILQEAERNPIRLLWFSVSPLSFSRFVDGVAVSSAVLLFNLLTSFMTDSVPAWWTAALFIAASAAVFGALYWMVFEVWFGITPGTRLAELACTDTIRDPLHPEKIRPRFR